MYDHLLDIDDRIHESHLLFVYTAKPDHFFFAECPDRIST
jgi:hypothetical protein